MGGGAAEVKRDGVLRTLGDGEVAGCGRDAAGGEGEGAC